MIGRKLTLLVMLGIFLFVDLKANGIENNVERITFISQDNLLVGYLSKPIGKEVFPVVVVLHSASHATHNNQIYNHLEATLNSLGIGVFTFDRRGSGESEGNFSTASLEDLAIDALNAIGTLKKKKEVDKKRVGLYGISQGGWIAPIAYHKAPKDISFMILVSSSGVSPARQMEYSAVTTLKKNGYSQEIIDLSVYLRNITNEYYRGNLDQRKTQTEIDQYKSESWFAHVYLPLQGNLPKDVSKTKWIHEMDFNPIDYLKEVKVPVALIYGEFDRWVPIDESITVWEKVMRETGNDDYSVFKAPGSGHMMIIDEDSNPAKQIISPGYTEFLKKWAYEYVLAQND